ncbi:hypothetical protein BRO54_0599 [Geobacillus proteiniphilus]|uniref:Uncharacterized protein n=1 Tax=Geobacillus proteiniphilus TaxID=860353 RepID=A0A1Q5T7G7_9BACL|nr:hypothetical protein BRO54_0599 [Geobacillus proteiniphilus]
MQRTLRGLFSPVRLRHFGMLRMIFAVNAKKSCFCRILSKLGSLSLIFPNRFLFSS